MAFDASFLLALLLILGLGCLKGNIAAQVGNLYSTQEEQRRSNGFAIFSTGINIGAVAGPLVCGLVAAIWGWHTGFGFAGILMLIAAMVYLAGFRDYAEDTPLAAQESVAPLTRAEVRMLAMIVMVLVLATIPFFAYDEGSNAGMIWISDKVDLATPFGEVPVAWFNSIDPLASILSVPLLIWIWQRRAARARTTSCGSRWARSWLSCRAWSWHGVTGAGGHGPAARAEALAEAASGCTRGADRGESSFARLCVWPRRNRDEGSFRTAAKARSQSTIGAQGQRCLAPGLAERRFVSGRNPPAIDGDKTARHQPISSHLATKISAIAPSNEARHPALLKPLLPRDVMRPAKSEPPMPSPIVASQLILTAPG